MLNTKWYSILLNEPKLFYFLWEDIGDACNNNKN